MIGKTVIILGGGVGGIVTANALRKQLPAQHRIMVVDKMGEYLFTPSLLWLMVGRRKPERVTRELGKLLQPGIELVQAEVREIDPERNRVETSDQVISYDYLVIALGADLAPETMPGFEETAHSFFDLEGASGLWSALKSFESGRVAVLVSDLPFKCPAAPYEAALLLDDYFRKQGIRERMELALYTPEPAPMGVAGAAMGQAVIGMLEAKGISFHPGLNTAGIDPTGKTINFENGRRESFDFLTAVPPHRPPAAVKNSPLGNAAGWISVNKITLQTQYENAYAIGDVTAITLANGKPLPKAGVFAHGEGEVVAQSIAADIQGKAGGFSYDGVGYCWIETGDGSAAFAIGQFYAEPDPSVPLPRSGRLWHLGKVMFESYWLGGRFSRGAARIGLNLGARLFNIPASL